MHGRGSARTHAGIVAMVVILLSVAISLVSTPASSSAQARAAVQVATGHIEMGQGAVYVLPDLQQGDTVYVYAEQTSGNLDPFVALGSLDLDISTVNETFWSDVNQAIAQGRDPLTVMPEFADQVFLVWDDDSGEGYAAALRFEVPADGAYRLMVSSNPTQPTFGDYQLLVGRNAPDVLTGQAAPTDDIIAVLDPTASLANPAVQEITDTLTDQRRTTFFALDTLDAGDTVYVYAEATSGDLAPMLVLRDFGNKPLSTANLNGQATTATLQHTFDDPIENVTLHVDACCDGGPATTGEYRLLIGINTPEVLDGTAAPTEQPVLQQATPVQVGLKLQQITGIDQQAENYGVVMALQMEWTDPRLAFSPDTCQCNFKTFRESEFIDFVTDQGIPWPEFTLFNQQGRRFSQNILVVIAPDGAATYFERFSATLQAPDFDFRQFPFDRQRFFVRIDSLYPEEFFHYTDLADFNELGNQLGEEEWIVTDFSTTISSELVSTQNLTSRFSFDFDARRHLTFYIFRIFVPILIIILVSWVTFFLRDYGKRVDVASANLLLFIAFNFTIAGELPRLGYLTLMDVILIGTFIVTGLVVVLNVFLKRMEASGNETVAHNIDRYVLWIYPLAYVVAVAVVMTLFFVTTA